MNFPTEFEKGRQGKNVGLDIGIKELTVDTLGIQKEHIYCIAAPPKVGKTTLADFLFVLAVICRSPNAKVDWIYYSWEISRIKKEFKFAAFFLFLDYKIQFFEYEGKQYKISADYLMGKLMDDNKKPIPVNDDITEKVKIIYRERIKPIFGEYNSRGQKIKKGRIDFIEEKDTPTGIKKYIMNYAKENGKFVMERYQVRDDNGQLETKYRVIGYEPNDPDKLLIVITDHVRKVKVEKGELLKQSVDKLASYQVDLRNLIKCTFVDIIHTNRNLFEVDRIKFAGEFLYPTPEDVKDTGNLSEEANVFFTMFDPNDDKYKLKKHFGLDLIDKQGKVLHPHYKSLHIVEARDIEGTPIHYQLNMFGNINWFALLKRQL